MNAYELADSVKLIYTDNPLAPTKLFVEVESMLRQQQAEIASLQKNLDVALMIVNEPAKTLTDEEIRHLASNCFVDWKGQHIVDFARAILRKAQDNG